MSPCPDPAALDRYLAQTPRPGDDDTAAIEGHLSACPACNRHLQARTDDPELRAWLRPDPPADARHPALGPPHRPGDLGSIDGFDIEGELGAGGMGVVFRARDAALGRAVAVKVLRPGLTDAASLSRFAREAAAAAGLRHDHLVPVYSVGATASGAPYAVMPLVPGPTLRQRLRAEPPLTPAEAADIVRQVADGLTAAHAAGLVHRDVKPSNVILDASDGRAKLTDFGLARRADAADGVTRDGVLAGTPEYMAPEQAADPGRADPRSDIYSLGVTLYELLTGVPPFRGAAPAVLGLHQSADPVPPSRLNARVPRDLETVCLAALRKDPARRYATAAAFADDLRRFLGGRPVAARPPGRAERGWRWARRHPWPAASAAAALLIAAGGAAGVAVLAGKNRELAAAVEQSDRSARLTADALDRVVVGFGRRLWHVPQAESVMLDTAQESAALHRRLHELRPADRAAAAAYANALVHLANLQTHYVHYAGAAATLDASRRFLDAERATDPDGAALGRAAVAALQARTTLCLAGGDKPGLLAAASAAAREAERLAAANPGSIDPSEAQMWDYSAQASAASEPKVQAGCYRRAVACAERWRAAAPESVEAANGLATCLDVLSTALTNAGDLGGAGEACGHAEAAYLDPLLTAAGDTRLVKGNLADVRANRGWLALKAGDPASAAAKFAEAEAVRRELLAAFPADPGLREKVLFALVYRAKAAAALGAPGDARRHLADARAIGDALAREYPQEKAYSDDLEAINGQLRKLAPAPSEPAPSPRPAGLR